jgi:hypothetical protein
MMRPIAHAVILVAVVAAVGCSVGAQYGVKILVDILAGGISGNIAHAWLGFLFLATLIAADNLLWRLASWIASSVFVGVTGDVRRDLFRHLTGHALSYFTDRMPGTLTSRITATSNTVYTLENMFVWNALPPCVATFVAIVFCRDGECADGGDADGPRRHHGIRHGPSRRCRQAAASRICQPCRRGRRRDVRRYRQHSPGMGVLRHGSRAQPPRCHDRSRNDGAPAQPLLSGEAAPVPRRDHSRLDHFAPGLGDRSGRMAPPLPATSSWYARSAFPSCMPRAIWPLRSWTSPSTWRGFRRRSGPCSCRIGCAIIRRQRRWRDRAQI